ncbi:MAG: biotin transporter BioY [Deltaproteobacteria bacterium]|jgi:biotin transport system substrate-specific component|nr:biotin transporter BioY [Deltaproteobacteria bacterium]
MGDEVTFSQMRRMVRLAVWAGFMSLGAWVSIPVGPVPITLQTFFIFLAAFIEGPSACLAVLLYLGAGFLGLPVFTAGLAGPAVLLGPTAGYALCFPITAAICGLARRPLAARRPPSLPRMIFFGLVGLAVLYLCGALGLVINMGFAFKAALAVNVTFLPGDLAKVAGASLVALGLARSGARLFSKETADRRV